MVRFAKWRVGESFVCISVCGVKVVCTCDMLEEMRKNRWKFACIKVPGD